LVRAEFNAKPQAVRDVVAEYVNYPMFKGEYNRQANKYEPSRSFLFHLVANSPMGTANQIKIVLMLGANVNVSNELAELGRTPLILAVLRDKPYRHTNDIVKTLIQHGAHVNAQDNLQSTALDYASERKNQNIIELLKQAGAKTDAQLQLEAGQTMQAKQPFVPSEELMQPAETIEPEKR
jgi:ankyrin repeat protein